MKLLVFVIPTKEGSTGIPPDTYNSDEGGVYSKYSRGLVEIIIFTPLMQRLLLRRSCKSTWVVMRSLLRRDDKDSRSHLYMVNE